MKKTVVLLFIAFIFYNNADSQITKGNWLVGGNASFSFTTPYIDTIGSKATIVTIAPNIGYFFIDKFAAGVRLSYQKNHNRLVGQNDNFNTATVYSIGPFARYYFLPTDKQFNILSQGSYEWGNEKESNNSYSNNTSTNSFTLSLGPVIYFNNCVGLEFLLSYTSLGTSLIRNSRAESYKAGIGLQIHLEKEKNY